MIKGRAVRAVASLLLMTAVMAGAADNNPRLFPFPLVETERMITRWFTDSGFRTLVEEAGSGEKQLRAQRGAEEWRLVLSPSSPLNTEVLAHSTGAAAGDAARLDALWSMLDRYGRGARPVTGDSQPVTGALQPAPTFQVAPVVQEASAPRVVLQHHEAIVCLENGPGTGHIQLSGFACSDSGLILTTAHDLREQASLTRSGPRPGRVPARPRNLSGPGQTGP